MKKLTILIISAKFLTFIIDSVLAGCLPSDLTPNDCSLCDFFSYTPEDILASNGLGSFSKFSKEKDSFYKRQVFVDSSARSCNISNIQMAPLRRTLVEHLGAL